MDPWWTQQAAGLVGGGLGGLVGVLGAVVGVVAGVYAPRGRGKGVVVGGLWVMIGLGVVCLVGGVVAVVVRQPYHVFYPLLLIGFVASVVGGCNAPVVLRRYRQAESRRLSAEELRRG